MVDFATGRPIAVEDRTTPADPDPAGLREQVQQMLRPAVVADIDEAQHDPSARLARLIDLRDLRCAGPGCSSGRCDRDHHIPHPQGPTSASNLGLLSRRCHRAKHTDWQLVRHPDGSTTWTSSLGRSYNRPGPHEPPPEADLYSEPPPLRPPPLVEPERGLTIDDLAPPGGGEPSSPREGDDTHEAGDEQPTAEGLAGEEPPF
jgi:hypothetical protein